MTEFIPEAVRDLDTMVEPGWNDLAYEEQADQILTALYGAGWRLRYPDELCQECHTIIEPGTRHAPFTCEVIRG